MAEIKGTNVAAPIVPFTDADVYATHEAKYGKGGWRSVETFEDLERIPQARLEEGMFGYVNNDPRGIHSYQWFDGKWVRSKISQGIPIYNQNLIDDLDINPEADTYISIPNPSDLDGEVTNKTYTTSINGNYVDILFRALRELQSEVAKLKNSFNYGIESYTGTTTAMTAIKSDLDEAVEEEPLWAIMEGNLSELVDITLGNGHPFEGDDIQVIIDDDTYDSYINFNGYAKWEPKDSVDEKSIVRTITDSKLFLYSILSRSRNMKANLNLYDLTTGSTINYDRYKLTIDFSRIDLPIESERDIYNILLVISRKQKMGDGRMYGKNFIWVSIGDVASGKTITEGYWKNNVLYDDIQELDIDITPDGNDVGTYTFENVEFNNTTLSKFKLYSKYQDFSKEVIPSRPDDESYKFKAAHITIRSVENQSVLVSVKDQILNNELIFVEDTKVLWIKSNNLLTQIAGGGSSASPVDPGNSGMTREEMIVALREMGIIQEENGDIKVNNLAVEDITFIHQASGRRFKFGVNEDGSLHSQEIGDASDSFGNKIKGLTLAEDVRGFMGQVRLALDGSKLGLSRTSDARLFSDRLKIGAFYAPFSSDIVHGCSHSYIELENTSDIDISLDGFYLHYTRPDGRGTQQIYHLPLTGIIPAGGTYLIRGKEHAPITDPNVYLKVTTYDQEWYNGSELISFEIDENIDISASKEKGYGFCLTFGNKDGNSDITYTTALVRKSKNNDVVGTTNSLTINEKTKSTYPYILNPIFVDGIYYYKMIMNSTEGYWATIAVEMKSNSIYRNTFQLDPAKQAFQAFTTKDSSRARWANVANDIQVVSLDNEFISFPHTEDVYPISNYTPRASYEHKNVSTDKSKLDKEKPNMVTTSFGIDIYKTRCFNWISVGYFPEYVWIKRDGETNWSKKIQSYIPIQSIRVTNVAVNVNSGSTETTVSFNVTTKGWLPGASLGRYTVLTGQNHKKIVDISARHENGIAYTATLSGDYSSSITNGDYFLHSPEDELATDTYPKKKFFNADVTNNVYARITGRFPGDNSFYVSHKAVVDIVSENVTSKSKYIYVVGRADKNGNPDPNHCSEEMSFTLCPDSYQTRIYQITDQQGFHWIEYQAWAALAKTLQARIDDDARSNVLPILVNTGDMTQNGTRINEWFDYYQAGRNLFNHLEQMNVVGNNDLCGPDPSELGTGDDSGKSNSFYFHLFYCYEVGSLFEPLISPTDASAPPKYIPSLYYFDSKKDRFLMVNSEITETCCKSWFKVTSPTHENKPVNVYTGYVIKNNSTDYAASSFTTIYTMIYRTLNDARTRNLKPIAVCHEMPFTVITSDSLTSGERSKSRSYSSSDALVGSHLNQISKNEVGSKGIYWFSRLLENFNVVLVLGGHKHTYSCTYPVRENYRYKISGSDEYKNSREDGKMVMGETLEGDTANFRASDNASADDLSKFPLTNRAAITVTPSITFYPYTPVEDLVGGITYFMCQASGYKLTSNKELPSPDQKFSRILPKTTSTYNETTGSFSDSADSNQKYPMLAIIDVADNSYSIKLARITNILNSKAKFNQYDYGTGAMGWQWLSENSQNNYGIWGNSEVSLITIQK